MHRLVRAAIGAGVAASLANPARGQSPTRIVRRADRAGLIIKLGTVLPSAVGLTPHRVYGSLVDLTQPTLISIDTLTDVSAGGCPMLSRLTNQICVDLAGGHTLDDRHRYLLTLDSVSVVHKPPLLMGQTIVIAAVGGRVLPPTHPVESVIVTYDVDLAGDSTVTVELRFGKKSAVARDIPIASPHCYRRGEFEFNCAVQTPIAHGDSLFAKLVHPDGSALPGEMVGVTDTVSSTAKDTVVNLKGGYSQTTAARSATLAALWQSMPIPGTHVQVANHDYSVSFDGSLSPYVNLLWTTDRKTTDYVNVGGQFSGYLSTNSPLRVLGFFVTPRVETDTKATVANFMYFDGEIRPNIEYLWNGPTFLGGHYSIVPHAGVELGHTIKGTTVARAESNNPSRWKAGVSAVLAWPAVESKTGFCAWVGCAGINVTADWQHYLLNHVPADISGDDHDWGTVSGTYKFTPHVGLNITFQNGDPPPLFTYQRCVQIGIALLY